jgi:ABC-type nitrate/sulfonate/bicarbonate transport system substrate-binding protein
VRRLLGLALLVLVAGGAVWAAEAGHVERLRRRLWGRPVRLSAGDFPPGVSAPVDDVASVPLRPVRLGFVPRGATAALAAAGHLQGREGSAEATLFHTAFAIDVELVPFVSHDEVRRALVQGAEAGGVDLAALTVHGMALEAALLRDAAPRAVLLLGKSRGADALAVPAAVTSAAGLKGLTVAVEARSPAHYFLLWQLSRVGASLKDLNVLTVGSSQEAVAALREGRAQAAAAPTAALEDAVKEKGAHLLGTTADAPHLVATVLVTRGDFAARYPDAIRRVVRGALEAGARARKDPAPAVALLGALAPTQGDPAEALRGEPPASLEENLAFFSLAGFSPVTWAELYESAALLGQRLEGAGSSLPAEEARDISALKFVAGGARAGGP